MKNAANRIGLSKPPAVMLFMAAALPLLFSCWAPVATVATEYAIDFAEDLLLSASDNYSPDYADDLKKVLKILAAETKAPTDKGYPGQAAPPTTPTPTAARLALDVAILVQRVSAGVLSDPVPIDDGATLYSDPNDPAAGDKLKISIRANCDCFVYVIAVDGTGFLVPVFPDFESIDPNPVQAHKLYIVPQADEWYGLDVYTGIEEIYFVASFTRRTELERSIKRLAAQKRRVRADYRPVRKAAVIPETRGLVKVKTGQPATVQAQSGETHDYTPTTFLATTTGADLVITRWFHHKEMAP